MNSNRHILCIGSALWDTVGRHDAGMALGHDRPGRITRIPGGVALNIAVALARLGLSPRVLTVIGRDHEGEALAAACQNLGVDLSLALRHAELPTDAYMAVEAANGLIAAIADAHSLEAAGESILAPLADGRLGSAAEPYGGTIAVDGNLTEAVLAEIAEGPLFAAADLRLAPASPGKALRLKPFLSSGRGTLYVNREEANLLSGSNAPDAGSAARCLMKAGVERCVVTDGLSEAVDFSATNCYRATPPIVAAKRVTGAGDTLMAVHIASELQGVNRGDALIRATEAAARFVAGYEIA